MRIHREGYDFLLGLGIGLFIWNLALGWSKPQWWKSNLLLSAGVWGFFAAFFRQPQRSTPHQAQNVFAPADGTIVNVERVIEGEFLGDERWMISIFMSVFNVHQNWMPIGGKITYAQYHAGKYLVALHPKSSELNERSTVVVESPSGIPVLVRQIAGLLARRIITYPQVGQAVYAGQELGFIKFGSRVDIFLPLDCQICVKAFEQVRGGESILAKFPDHQD